MTSTTLDRDELLTFLERMLLIRRFEERAAHLRSTGFIPGFLHPYIGQEAVAVGVGAALGPHDALTSTHRGHGHLIGRGADPARMYAELFARDAGYNRGKGGSLHMIDTDLGFLGANGIVGAGIPIAGGAALQLKRLGNGGVAVSYFGDGASNEGAFHETLNMASLWKLPVVFVCENNLYGEFTRQDKHQTVTDIAGRAASYSMRGVIVDGNDVEAVHAAAGEAVALARAGEGPTLLEAKTYRHRGHFEGDMARYRPDGELEDWLARDPIVLFTARLLADDRFEQSDIDGVVAGVEERLDAATEWAKEQRSPFPEEALENVYVDSINGKALL